MSPRGEGRDAAGERETLVADRATGRLLGGTVIGDRGACGRIDVIATALAAKLRVAGFEQLDLAYAPPFSPVWDPVLIAADLSVPEERDRMASQLEELGAQVEVLVNNAGYGIYRSFAESGRGRVRTENHSPSQWPRRAANLFSGQYRTDRKPVHGQDRL